MSPSDTDQISAPARAERGQLTEVVPTLQAAPVTPATGAGRLDRIEGHLETAMRIGRIVFAAVAVVRLIQQLRRPRTA